MKKRVLSLALAGALAIGGGIGYSVPNVQAEETRFVWEVGSSITLGVGESMPSVSNAYNTWLSFRDASTKDYTSDFFDLSPASPVALKEGKCKLYVQEYMTGNYLVTSKGKVRETLKVTIKKAPETVKWSKKSLKIKVGKTTKVPSAKVNKGSASYSMKVESSNPSIVSVDGSKLKGIAKGNATLTVTTYNGKTASLPVIVK